MKNDSLESRTIDWLRFVLASLVVLQHTYALEPLAAGKDSLLPIVTSGGICTVAVPLFFFISGFLFFGGLADWDWSIWKTKIRKRAKTLLLPYILWNLIALGAKILRLKLKGIPFSLNEFLSARGGLRIFWDCSRYDIPDIQSVLGYNIHIGSPIDSPLWFIRDLMILCLLSPALYFLLKKAGKLILPLSGALMVLSIWIPFEGCSAAAFFFFSAGAFLQIRGKDITEVFSRVKYPSYILSVLLLAAAKLPFYTNEMLSSCLMNLFTVTGSIAAFNIAASLLQSGRAKVKEKLVNSSFFIYALHLATVLSLAGTVICKLIPPSNALLFNLDYLLIPSVTTAVCFGLYCLLDAICPKLLSILTGGR